MGGLIYKLLVCKSDTIKAFAGNPSLTDKKASSV